MCFTDDERSRSKARSESRFSPEILASIILAAVSISLAASSAASGGFSRRAVRRPALVPPGLMSVMKKIFFRDARAGFFSPARMRRLSSADALRKTASVFPPGPSSVMASVALPPKPPGPASILIIFFRKGSKLSGAKAASSKACMALPKTAVFCFVIPEVAIIRIYSRGRARLLSACRRRLSCGAGWRRALPRYAGRYNPRYCSPTRLRGGCSG